MVSAAHDPRGGIPQRLGGEGLLHAHALGRDFGRQSWSCLRLPHLGQDLVSLRVGCFVKVNPQPHLTAVRIERVHVIHLVDAADLLFNRRRNRLFDGNRIASRIGCRDNDFGRRNVRIERDR